jgi:adenylate kinase family enzyme
MADFEGPLSDFYERVKHIRRIVVVVELVAKAPTLLVTSRPGIDIPGTGPASKNTANAMSMVFLASGFEEFVREEIGQCADLLSLKYPSFSDEERHAIRGAYWSTWVERLRYAKTILTKKNPKTPDMLAIAKVRKNLDSAKAFAVDDNAALLDRSVFTASSNNFRPHVVDTMACRVGIKNLINDAADSAKLRARFGVTSKKDAAEKLRARLDEFYDRRNEIVHSLNSTTGYAVDVIIEYTELFEEVAESMKNVLKKNTSTW